MPIDLSGMGKKILPKLLGKIAIGRKTAAGYPEKLDHFIFTDPVDPKTKIATPHKVMTESMKELYGDKPREIRVVLPFHHIDEVFYTHFASYPSTSWDCKSDDGVTAIRKLESGEVKEVPCNYETCEWRWRINNKKQRFTTCKPTGLLSVFILDAPVTGGVWRFTTHSYLSINEMLQTLQMIQSIRGSLQGVEVLLKVRMVQKEIKDDKGGTSKQNVPVVSLEVPYKMKALADGTGTVYGDFRQILSAVRTVNALPDRQILKELSTTLDSEQAIEDIIVESETSVSSTSETDTSSFDSEGAPKDDVDLF
jgi:hypothetical protein